jgi:hypothetical protein
VTDRDDALEKHELWNTLDSIESALPNFADDIEEDSDAMFALSRVRATVEYVRSRIGRSDPELLPISILDQLQIQSNNVLQGLTGVQSPNRNRRREPSLDNASMECDQLILITGSIPVVLTSDDANDLRDRVSALRRTFGQYRNSLGREQESLRTQFQELCSELNALRSEIESEKGKLTDAVAQSTSEESRASDERDKAAKEQRDVFEHRYDQLEDSLMDQSRNLLMETTDWLNKRKSDVDDTTNMLLNDMNAKLEEAKELVGLVANTAVAGDYQRNADYERKRADLWSFAAIGLFGVTVLLVFLALQYWITPEQETVGQVGRFLIAVPVGAAAGYAIQQSREHRARERYYRSLELELAALSPYIDTLPEPTKQELKAALTSRYFIGANPEAHPLVIREAQKGQDGTHDADEKVEH